MASSGVQYTMSSPWERNRMVTGRTRFSCSTPSVISMGMFWLPVRTAMSRQYSRALRTGTATTSRRLRPVAVRSFGGAFPLRWCQVRAACDQSAIACRAVVFPQLLGPASTAGWSSSIRVRSPKRLKFRISR